MSNKDTKRMLKLKSFHICHWQLVSLFLENWGKHSTIKTLRHQLLRKPRDLCTCILCRKLIILFFQAVEVILTLLPPIIGLLPVCMLFISQIWQRQSLSQNHSLTPIFAKSFPCRKNLRIERKNTIVSYRWFHTPNKVANHHHSVKLVAHSCAIKKMIFL